MAHKNIEIEIQVNVQNSAPLLAFLESNGIFQSEKRQVDEYFTPAHKDYLATRPVPEWFRLRDADGNFFMNYKKWHFDEAGKSRYCDEIETTVGSVEQAKKIVSALGFKSIAKVDKVRKTWTYKDYEIGIDSVKTLGDFVEIEYIGKDDNIDPDKVTSEMVDFLKKIGCGKITRNYVGYPFLILFPDEVTYEVQ